MQSLSHNGYYAIPIRRARLNRVILATERDTFRQKVARFNAITAIGTIEISTDAKKWQRNNGLRYIIYNITEI